MGVEDFDRVELLFGPSPVHPLLRLGEHLGEHEHRCFADRVDAHIGQGRFTGNRSEIDHLAAAALAHTRHTSAHQTEVTLDVDIKNLVPVALFTS